MAFERIAIVQGKTKASAGVTITQTGKVVIALRRDIVAQAGFKAGASYSVLLGSDDDHGKLRIVLDKAGVPCARELKRTGAFFFSLGSVPAVGTTPSHQRPTEACLIENGVEIVIPEDDGPKLLPAPARGSERKLYEDAQAPAKLNGAVPAKGEKIGDVVICLVEDEESISFRGKDLIISGREAKFLQILAKPRPNPIALSFIVDKLWDGKPPATAMVQVAKLASDLRQSLTSIGLTVNHVKGVGYQLKDA